MALRLSKKYGINPSLLLCSIYGNYIGIEQLGANSSKKAPYKIISIDLCNDWKQKIKEGNTFILSAKQTSEGIQPTGAYILVPNACLNIPVPPKGICFMEESEFNKLIKSEQDKK